MHHLFFLTIGKKHAKNSKEAREYANRYLRMNGFCIESEISWDKAIADWFVIGGRWSGNLNPLCETFDEKVKIELPATLYGYSYGFVEQHAKDFQSIWESLGGKGTNPMNRDRFRGEGYQDDAYILDERLYEYISKKIEEYNKEEEGEPLERFYQDETEDCLTKEMIGNRWLVSVDFHD